MVESDNTRVRLPLAIIFSYDLESFRSRAILASACHVEALPTGEPEPIVMGLKPHMAHFVINECGSRVHDGERFKLGERYCGFLESFDVEASDVPLSAYGEYFGHALEFYGGPHFKVLQLVYPTTNGSWPWASEASESFRNHQPLLANIS